MITDRIFDSYINGFHAEGEPYLITLAKCTVPSKIVLERYKSLPALELNNENLQALMAFANEVFPDKGDDFKLNFCKIVYTIGESI